MSELHPTLRLSAHCTAVKNALSTRILNLKRSAHTGDIFGASTQALCFIVSLGIALQAITGALIWWNASQANEVDGGNRFHSEERSSGGRTEKTACGRARNAGSRTEEAGQTQTSTVRRLHLTGFFRPRDGWLHQSPVARATFAIRSARLRCSVSPCELGDLRLLRCLRRSEIDDKAEHYRNCVSCA
jgi:hypothetical protein